MNLDLGASTARSTCGLVAMTSAPHAEGRQLDPGQVYDISIASETEWRLFQVNLQKKLDTLLDLCVSSLRRGHANLLCIVPILTDDPRRESKLVGRRAMLPAMSAEGK